MAFYYSNQEYSDGTVFLDGNLAVNKNGGNIVNEVFTTPGDVLYTGGTIYQDDSIFAQASGNTTAYPEPSYGTSTRRLYVVDSAGNTINDTTVDYNSSTNKTFTVVGGRTYYVRGYTNFSYPTSATLTLGGLYEDGYGYYRFFYTLSDAVDGNLIINNGGAYADLYTQTGCSGGSEGVAVASAEVTITKGQYGFGEIPTAEPISSYLSYRLNNFVYVNGDYYANGSAFAVGGTTVTVSIVTGCQAIN